MISELIVTSAPRGLQAGRSGFTTVCRTRGIHPDLASRLEAASAYRHIFPQGDVRNPVIFTYNSKPSSLGEVWVMSRVADAGTDYTGRSNKIAHHIALQQSDLSALVASNPAAVMAALTARGGLLTKWEGEPRENPVPPQVPVPPTNPEPCRRWESIAGDGGWAGVLVEHALRKEVTWLIVPPATDVLALFSEALALVSPGQRWQLPFTTYSLRGDEGRWLAAVAGSSEAEAALAQKRVPVIDLTKHSLAPAESPYVSAARGSAPVPWYSAGTKAPVRSTQTRPTPQGAAAAQQKLFPNGERPTPSLPPMLSRAAPAASAPPPELVEWQEVDLHKRHRGSLFLVAAFGALVLLCALIFGFSKYSPEGFRQGWEKFVALFLKPASKPNDEKVIQKTPDPPKVEDPTSPRQVRADGNPADSKFSDTPTAKPRKAPPPAQTQKEEPKTVTAAQPQVFDLIEAAVKAEGHLPRDGLNNVTRVDLKNADNTDIKYFLVQWTEKPNPTSLAAISLRIPELKDAKHGRCQLVPVPEKSPGAERQWQCTAAEDNGVIGTFTLTSDSLSFAKAAAQPPAPDNTHPIHKSLLPFLPLIISSTTPPGDRSTWVQLIRPPTDPIAREGAGSFVLYDNKALASSQELLEDVFGETSQCLKWRDLSLQVEDPVQVQLSLRREMDFRDTLDLPQDEKEQLEEELVLWWRPSCFSKSKHPPEVLSAFHERVTVPLKPRIDGGQVVQDPAYFSCDKSLSRAFTEENPEKTLNAAKAQALNLLKRDRRITDDTLTDKEKERLRLNPSQWSAIIETVAKHGIAFTDDASEALPPGVKEKLLRKAYPEEDYKKDAPQSLRDWINNLQKKCERDSGFIARTRKKAKELVTDHPFLSAGDRPKQPNDAAAWEELQKKYNQEIQKTADALGRDPISLMEWADECLENTVAPPPELVALSLWRILYKYQQALDHGFVCTATLQNADNDPALKDLSDLAATLRLAISGKLELEWEKGLPSVHVATFGSPRPEQVADGDSQKKEGNGAVSFDSGKSH